jgi:protein-L-isoaspartate O-methyltransferase
VSWRDHAERLAALAAHPVSRWRPAIAATPRHVFVPAWWEGGGDGGWLRRDAGQDPAGPYRNRSLVTRAGPAHADHAAAGDRAEGRPTSSSTKPGLVVAMYRHGMIGDGMDVLDIGTGSGYGTALLCARLGGQHVTSIDVDPYLVRAAAARLEHIGLHPGVRAGDATGPLDGEWDRIVSMTSVSPVPASWLNALRPGGRIVTTITGTGVLITADKDSGGGACGRAEWHQAGFMHSRTGPDYPPSLLDQHPQARDGDGEHVTASPYPLPRAWSWELSSMLAVTVPGISDHYGEHDGVRTAWLLHPDGSWARATATGDEPPVVRQAGPQRLWDILDALRYRWLRDGSLPVYGSDVAIAPDGAVTFTRGAWTATIPAQPQPQPQPTRTAAS